MKSVVFVVSGLYIGGVEKALLGVIRSFLDDGWDVHVAITRPDGSNIDMLPKECTLHVIKDFYGLIEIIHSPVRSLIIKKFKQRHFSDCLKYTWIYADIKLRKTYLSLYKHAFKSVQVFSNYTYDLAIAFAGPDPFIDYYVSERILAREKWGWIHFDIQKYGIDKGIMLHAGRKYNKINIVSKEGKQIFDSVFPELSQKTNFEPNIIDRQTILREAKKDTEFPNIGSKKIILTVGRISREKGQFVVLDAVLEMLKQGERNFSWWLVGDGVDKDNCMRKADELGVKDFVCFWGAKSNPYPYMAKCDIYVQPSLHEGFCITLAEALLFNKPIVSTNFTGAAEQLSDYSQFDIVPVGDHLALSNAVINRIIC